METDKSYQQYQRFLTEIENKFAQAMVGKTEEEKKQLLTLAEKVISSFRDLYGTNGGDDTLLQSARLILLQQPVHPN